MSSSINQVGSNGIMIFFCENIEIAISGKCLLTGPESEYCLILLKKCQSIIVATPISHRGSQRNNSAGGLVNKKKILVKKTQKTRILIKAIMQNRATSGHG